MLMQIFSKINDYYCKGSDRPTIFLQPVIRYVNTEENNTLSVCSKENVKFKSIDTILDFSDSTFLYFHGTSDLEVIKNFKILFVDTQKRRSNNDVFIYGPEFAETTDNNFANLEKIFYKIYSMNQCLLSLRPENSCTKNPLIQYLEDHQTKAFKLCFVFSGLPQKNIQDELCKIIDKVEAELRPVNILIYEKIASALKEMKDLDLAVRESCNSQNITEYLKIQIKTLFDLSKELPTLTKIEETCKVKLSEKKEKAVLSFKEKFRQSIIKKILSSVEKQIEDVEKKTTKAFENITNEIKNILLDRISNNMNMINITNMHRHKIFEVFNKENTSCKRRKPCALDLLINKLKKKTEDASRLVVLETAAFKLNPKTDNLEEVEEEKGVF
ncbi:hypothetical protein CDIK_2176 [Cucumispora dikerogammari]|nr:hypothetical protein CDIK_2176 [Cucumispora dikerogammari]